MKCPGCGTAQSTVFKTLDDERAISRQRRCKCGGRWYTDERVRKGSFMVISEPLVAIREPGAAVSSSSPQKSGSDLSLISEPDQASSKPSDAPAMKPPVFKGMPLAATGKTWDVPADLDAELALGFPALDRAAEYQKAKIWLVASPSNRKTDKGMPRFLLNWFGREQNRGGRTAGAGPDNRCHFHRSPGTLGKRPPAGWFSACPECKHARAGTGTRQGDPGPVGDLVAATERKLARDRGVVNASAEQLAELRGAR